MHGQYGVKAGMDQRFWEEKGWINPQDPRGWFQWYTRFFLGRRTADDQRQISRWRGVAGAKGRWKRFLLNKIVAADAHVDDVTISPVVRQTMLHWAYEVNQEDMRRHLKLRKSIANDHLLQLLHHLFAGLASNTSILLSLSLCI